MRIFASEDNNENPNLLLNNDFVENILKEIKSKLNEESTTIEKIIDKSGSKQNLSDRKKSFMLSKPKPIKIESFSTKISTKSVHINLLEKIISFFKLMLLHFFPQFF